MQRGFVKVSTGELREELFVAALERLIAVAELGEEAAEDSFRSMLILGLPGVGKSAVARLAAKDVAATLSELYGHKVDYGRISLRMSLDKAVEAANRVREARLVPILHLYAPQLNVWDIVGTPAPVHEKLTVTRDGIQRGGSGEPVYVTPWRLDPYMLPFMRLPGEKKPVPRFIVIDEFNMAEPDVLKAFFQLARAAELGRIQLSPTSVVMLIGNPREVNIYAASELPLPLLDRATKYYVEKPSVDGWLAFMREVYGDKWDERVGSFLMLNPESIYVQKDDAVQTPRGFTQVAVSLYLLDRLLKRGLITREVYMKRARSVIYGTLLPETAASLWSFITTLSRLRIDKLLENPEEIANMEPNVAAYALLHLSRRLGEEYAYARREEALDTLAELARYAVKPLGVAAVSYVLASLPMNVRLALARKLPGEVLDAASKAAKYARELEEVIS